MREEYDFSNAVQGKFYRPIEELDIPIYLDKDIKEFLMSKIKNNSKEFSLNSIVNALLKQDIEISKKLSYS
ncbi:MAG: hypothetical protein KU38_02050 [Sulfurovum sp. FS08-3]|nr:MAG: hypothetical protein KU38_02050 [Sulfurovum sp. FS08-3]